MFTRISLFAWALLAATGVDAKQNTINQENGNIKFDSDVGRHIMKHARRVQDNYYNGQYDGQYYGQQEQVDWGDIDTSFLASFSVKFQGCHHVQQWNPEAQDQDDVRIMTKRLVRFRLCPQSDCLSDLSGCTSKYGDYVVDMNIYIEAFMAQNQYQMDYYQQNYGQRSLEEQRKLDEFSLEDYLECSEVEAMEQNDRKLDENNNNWYEENYSYYVGPYCADQGGEIRLGVFSDDTCSAFANNGEQKFYNAMGFNLPYSSQSMVSMACMQCGNGYYQQGGDAEDMVDDFCGSIYQYSGKCETKMNIPYPNESSCSYIEGIKIIREDGVIRTAATKKSKAAAVCIGLFLTIAVLLAGYVYYLRTKLGRAKINLAAASQTLS